MKAHLQTWKCQLIFGQILSIEQKVISHCTILFLFLQATSSGEDQQPQHPDRPDSVSPPAAAATAATAAGSAAAAVDAQPQRGVRAAAAALPPAAAATAAAVLVSRG